MPTSALEWVLFLSILPFYLAWGYMTGFRVGYWAIMKLFGEDEALTMTCFHPFCWVYWGRELRVIPAYMLGHFKEHHPEEAERLEQPTAEALRR